MTIHGYASGRVHVAMQVGEMSWPWGLGKGIVSLQLSDPKREVWNQTHVPRTSSPATAGLTTAKIITSTSIALSMAIYLINLRSKHPLASGFYGNTTIVLSHMPDEVSCMMQP